MIDSIKIYNIYTHNEFLLIFIKWVVFRTQFNIENFEMTLQHLVAAKKKVFKSS